MMQIPRRTAVAMLTGAALVGSGTTAVSALGHDGGNGPGDRGAGQGDRQGERGGAVLSTSMAPSVPADPTLHGAAAGGAPWVLGRGEASLRRDGALRVSVRGLVIPVAPGNGTPGPVTTVTASLYCGNDTTPVGTTPPAPISRTGDARMSGQLTLPAKCLAPVVLVHPNAIAGVYIAASGFGG